MLFNSLEFLVFFVLVYAAYRILSSNYRRQNLLILVASYFFYGWWDIRFLFLIVITTVVDFNTALIIRRGFTTVRERVISSTYLLCAALLFLTINWAAIDLGAVRSGSAPSVDWGNLLASEFGLLRGLLLPALAVVAANGAYFLLQRLTPQQRARTTLGLSIAANLMILGFFKYYNFFAQSFTALATSTFGITPDPFTLEIILPVGISFYTFQSMSYTIDSYRRDVEPTTSIVDFAAYLSFFPQLVAGPIERGKHLLPQFQRPRVITNAGIRRGMWLIAWGLYKKVVIADNLAAIVNTTFGPYDGNDPLHAIPDDGLRIAITILAFAVQIYADFSGYTDIARGTAKLMGFDIMVNFRLPYFSKDPSEFWQRWHISLSSWLRDYLYISLGGNRGGTLFTYRNLILTMVLGGLWHGAAWNFVFWGIYQGLILVLYRMFDQSGLRTPEFLGKDTLQRFTMFLLVLYGWLIFRSQNAYTIYAFSAAVFAHPHWSAQAMQDLKDLLFFAHPLVLFQVFQAAMKTQDPMARWPGFVRLSVWIFVILSIMALASSGKQEFIYFAF